MALRDAEFEEYYRAYMATTKLDDPLQKVAEDKVIFQSITVIIIATNVVAHENCDHPYRGSRRRHERRDSSSSDILS